MVQKKEKAEKAPWQLRLYIAGKTNKSVLALNNIEKYCKENLQDNYSIEVIDLMKDPHMAEEDQIFAIPTLVRRSPVPVKKVIGDLSNETKVLNGLEIKPLLK